MDINNTTPVKLNTKTILKMLPKGFTAVRIPTKTRIVYIEAKTSLISKDDALAAVKKVAKDLGLVVVIVNDYGSEFYHFSLEDLKFTKEMRIKAKECLKVVKDFYKKYGIAYRFDDNTCGIVRNIMRTVNNDE